MTRILACVSAIFDRRGFVAFASFAPLRTGRHNRKEAFEPGGKAELFRTPSGEAERKSAKPRRTCLCTFGFGFDFVGFDRLRALHYAETERDLELRQALARLCAEIQKNSKKV